MKTRTQSKENSNFIEIYELMGQEFYDFYRQHRTHQALAIDQYNYFEKAIGGICNLIKKNVASCNAGVHIRNIGYFCYVRSKNKRRNIKEKNPLKKHLKKYGFYFWFYPDEDLKEWSLDPILGYFPKLNSYFVTPESANVYYEMKDHNNKLNREGKEIKFLK